MNYTLPVYLPLFLVNDAYTIRRLALVLQYIRKGLQHNAAIEQKPPFYYEFFIEVKDSINMFKLKLWYQRVNNSR